MASFHVNGADDLAKAFKEAGTVPEGVTKSMLTAMANIAKEAQARLANSMLHGYLWTGTTANSIQSDSPRVTSDGGKVTISFKGSRIRKGHNERNATIAFINEFGKKHQPARPFIKEANTKNEDKINAAGETEFNKWLQSIGL